MLRSCQGCHCQQLGFLIEFHRPKAVTPKVTLYKTFNDFVRFGAFEKRVVTNSCFSWFGNNAFLQSYLGESRKSWGDTEVTYVQCVVTIKESSTLSRQNMLGNNFGNISISSIPFHQHLYPQMKQSSRISVNILKTWICLRSPPKQIQKKQSKTKECNINQRTISCITSGVSARETVSVTCQRADSPPPDVLKKDTQSNQINIKTCKYMNWICLRLTESFQMIWRKTSKW